MANALGGQPTITVSGVWDMAQFDDLLRTADGRRLHAAQGWFQRRFIALAVLCCLMLAALAFVRVRGPGEGLHVNRWQGMAGWVAILLLLFGGMHFLRRQATRLPGARCPYCGNPLLGPPLPILLNSGVCANCKTALPYTAA